MKLTELPNLTFAAASAEEISDSVKAAVEAELGRTLARADPLRIFLRGIEYIILQQRLLIDECAKQNLLYYATGDNLEHLGALVGVERLRPVKAVCTVRFRLSAPRERATVIPAGIRVTAGDRVFFDLKEDLVFLAGEVERDGTVECETPGTVGNRYAVGEINTVVDPQPFLQSAVNITESDGGSDLETDDSLRERIHEAPESFSNAGSTGAYRWHTFNASPLIADVAILSPTPGTVRVYPLLEGGELPTDEIIQLVYNALNDRAVRPLTDFVEVLKPEPVEYRINVEFWIAASQVTSAASIEANAEQAIREYILWQRSALGRDIEPTELIYRMRRAGVKRINLLHPVFFPLDNTQIAVPHEQMRIVYKGLEAD